jgi:hypothetical protein
MTVAVAHTTSTAVAPVTAALQALLGTDDLPGLAPSLVVTDEDGWTPATELVNGAQLPTLLDRTRQWLGAAPPAAAALSWKIYTYWLALPAVHGWASVRRVPLLDPADVLVRFDRDEQLVTVGLRRSTVVAVLATDPLALTGLPQVRIVADEADLLDTLRTSLLDSHLAPMIAAIRARVRIGQRSLLGSVASGVAYILCRRTPQQSAESVNQVLSALGVDDLVDLVPGPTGELTVQRKTCCLAFTLPSPKICAGCCIRRLSDEGPDVPHPDAADGRRLQSA